MAKDDKSPTGKASTAKASKAPAANAESGAAPAGKPSGKPPSGKAPGGLSMPMLLLIGAAVAVTVAIGVYAYRGGFSPEATAADEVKSDPSVTELMETGPLPEMVMGSADAPNTIVEYASMTCPHCAHFQITILPELKTKYIDTGKARYILREFPLDNLAVAAFMVARCAGDDRYYPMIDALFDKQDAWAVRGDEGKDKLLLIARQAGMSKEKFDQCLADKALFDKIVAIRTRANEKFGVDSTPTFFVNGKRLGAEHEVKDFDAVIEGTDKPAGTAPSGQ